jgi:hypothetical protein
MTWVRHIKIIVEYVEAIAAGGNIRRRWVSKQGRPSYDAQAVWSGTFGQYTS